VSMAARQLATRHRIGKWLGLLTGAAAWALDQQIIATAAYARCPAKLDSVLLLTAVSCALLALVGGVVSLRVWQALPAAASASHTDRVDRFIAALSVLLAGVSLLFIVFSSAAAFILGCETW
jgi:hypothetical protein